MDNKLHVSVGDQCLHNVQCAARHNHLKLRGMIMYAISQHINPDNWYITSAVYIDRCRTAQKWCRRCVVLFEGQLATDSHLAGDAGSQVSATS